MGRSRSRASLDDDAGTSLIGLPNVLELTLSPDALIQVLAPEHWYLYEITRCSKIDESAVSTGALYGNTSLRHAFTRRRTVGG